MTTVYGIRLRGTSECRYVGQSKHGGAARLASHLSEARKMVRWAPRPTAFARWLVGHADEVEAFTFVICADDRARDEERRAVGACLALGHALFNRQLVPACHRVEPWRGPFSEAAAA